MMSDLVTRARRYALVAHIGQKYGDEFPYIIHLQTAYNVALRFGITNENILCAIWLHDTLEDTDREYEDLCSVFNETVAQIVSRVTEPKGLSRKERHAATYPRILESDEARIVKLCDRISHLEFGGAKTKMYRKEHYDFCKNLCQPLRNTPEELLWTYLHNLIAEIP